ncbi:MULTISPECIES: hypothetical protein [Streptomyces]|uniref:Uncharacterized protein n=1 Tax=Streptomyces changanensis TaxID=2964669 RepID=A0ABY5N1H1_9ACTN|nr:MULTISPECIES: hypothetical protein [Streptomyces]UUS29767.1 hypothetical protein NRO40_02230 [Streptomyces changanensis]
MTLLFVVAVAADPDVSVRLSAARATDARSSPWGRFKGRTPPPDGRRRASRWRASAASVSAAT